MRSQLVTWCFMRSSSIREENHCVAQTRKFKGEVEPASASDMKENVDRYDRRGRRQGCRDLNDGMWEELSVDVMELSHASTCVVEPLRARYGDYWTGRLRRGPRAGRAR